jgi:drug/metabolite transporter (DMT)-like permease
LVAGSERLADAVSDARQERRLGMALVAGAAVAWSTAGFFTRLLPYDAWTILFWRGVFGCAFTAAFLVASQRGDWRSVFRIGWPGWVVAILSTTGMMAFIPALQTTSVANVAIINATGPFVAACIAWLWLGERAPRHTLVASLGALAGVVIMVGGTRASADLLGIALACVMRLALSSMTVTIRRYREAPMVAAAALSNLLGSVASAPLASSIIGVSAPDLGIFVLFGLFQITLGLTLFVTGSRLLPPSQASLISALQTPLMPFWVWLAFSEIPSTPALIGGALVVVAVVGDILWQMPGVQRRRGVRWLPATSAIRRAPVCAQARRKRHERSRLPARPPHRRCGDE